MPDEVLFELGPKTDPSAIASIVRQYRLALLRADRITLLNTTIYRMRFLGRGRTLSDVLRVLRADGRIASVQVNNTYRLQDDRPARPAPASSAPAAPSLQWAAEKMQLAAAHRISQGGDVLVAMLDSGIDATHPELAGAQVTLVDLIETPFKPNVHGTAMAGALLAHARLLGVAPSVHILEIRVFDAKPASAGAEGTTDHILRGLDAAFVEKANIVNLSFAGPPDDLLSRTLAVLRQKGLIVVAAAGNGGPKSPPLFPGADPSVIAVTATDQSDTLYTDANRGAYIHIAAPGVDILEPAPGGAYQMTSGTSVAAVHVSGIVALMLARNIKLDPETVQHMLTDAAGKLPTTEDAAKDPAPGLANAYGVLQIIDREQSKASAPTVAITH